MKDDLSLILMVSQPQFMSITLECLEKVIPEYNEILIAIAPNISKSYRRKLKKIPKVKISPGTNDREKAGEIRYGLLDKCKSKWIVNLDDDDFWTHFPDMINVSNDVGFVYGDSIFVGCTKDKRSPLPLGTAKYYSGTKIEIPKEIYRSAGSQWILRTEAWKQISPIIDRDWWFSDFKIIYHLLKSKWEILHLPEVFGIVRLVKYDYPVGGDMIWNKYVEKLDI